MTDYEIRVEDGVSRPLAAVRGTATRANLGGTILALLDQVWPVIRAQEAVRPGQNVVVYVDGLRTIEAGVEVFGEFHAQGAVQLSATPAGPAATIAYFGEYSKMAPAYEALEAWCAATGHQRAGPSWEVYGDWHEDPQQCRTDIYFLLRS